MALVFNKIMAKVSVIIPIYNVEEYLERCLDSVIAQTFSDIEIILVDDGSTDKSGIIAKQYADKDARIKMISQNNKGLSGARNTGIKNATSDYLMFLDSDDYFENTIVEKSFKRITETKSDIAIFPFASIDESNNVVACTKENYLNLDFVEKPKDIILHIENCVWDKMYKKVLFEGIEFPEGYFYEDLGTTYRLLAKSKKIVFLNDIGLYYLTNREGRITSTFDRRTFSIFAMCDLIRNFYIENNLYEEYKKELNKLFVREIVECVKQSLLNSEKRDPMRDEFIEKAYNYLKENCENIKYEGDKSFLYNNKNLLKIYLKIKGI